MFTEIVLMFVLVVCAVLCDECPPCQCDNSLTYKRRITCDLTTVNIEKLLDSIPKVNYSVVVRWEEITITDQEIYNITQNAFSNVGLSTVKYIIINRSLVKTIHKNAFWNVTKLHQLDLRENQITNLSDDIFDFTRNIQYLLLAGNKLESINDKLLANLSILTILELDNNLIKYIDKNAFSHNKILQQLLLNNNRLKQLDLTVIRTLNLNKLEISGNPWYCDCSIKELNDLIIAKSNAWTEVRSVTCASPKDFEGKLWREIKIDRLNCSMYVKAQNEQIVTTVGQNATLSCEVTSNTKPNDFWLFGNIEIKNKTRKYNLSSYNDKGDVKYFYNLTILNIKKEDCGIYTCTYTTDNETVPVQIELILEKQPLDVNYVAITTGVFAFILCILLIAMKCMIKYSINNRSNTEQPTFQENSVAEDIPMRPLRAILKKDSPTVLDTSANIATCQKPTAKFYLNEQI